MKWYNYVYYSILLIGVITGLMAWRNSTRAYKVLTILMLLTLISENTARLMVFELGFKSNIIVYTIYNPVATILFTYVFYEILPGKKIKQALPFIGLAIVIAMLYFSMITTQKTIELYGSLIQSLYFIMLSLLKFREMMLNPESDETDILKEPSFWLCSGILFFYTVNILFWFASPMKFSAEIKYTMRYVLIYSNFLMYAIFGYSLWLFKAHKRKSYAG